MKEKSEAEWTDKIYGQYGESSAEELDVIPGTGSGTYLERALIESCMRPGIPVLRLALANEFTLLPKPIREAETRDWCEEHLAPLLAGLDPNLDHYFGEDFARSGDLTTVWPMAEKRDLHLETPFLLELRNVPFEQQKQIVFYLIDRLPRFRAGAMDARGNGQWLAEVAMQQYGASRIAMVMLSAEWYRENFPRVKAAFEDQMLEVPQDADVLGDLRAVKLEKGVPKVPDKAHTKGSDGRDRHGDTAIALVMVIHAIYKMVPAGGACNGFESISKRGNAGPDDHNTRRGPSRDDHNASSRSML